MLAYLNRGGDYSEGFVVFPEVLEKTPFRVAIAKINEYMIKNSQYMVCYINHTFSNTYTFVKMAKSKKLKIINVGDLDLDEI